MKTLNTIIQAYRTEKISLFGLFNGHNDPEFMYVTYYSGYGQPTPQTIQPLALDMKFPTRLMHKLKSEKKKKNNQTKTLLHRSQPIFS